MVLHLNKRASPSPKGALCQVWLKLAQCFWERRFLNILNVSSLFHSYLHVEMGVTLHLSNLNPLHPKKLVEISPGEEEFKNSSMYFRYFVIISPWKRVGTFIWRNLNPYHPRMLCVKFGWNWPGSSGKILSLFRSYLPLRKGHGPSFEQTWIPVIQGCFVPSLEKKMKMRKVYDNNDDNDNDDGQRTNFDRKSSLEPSAQVS